MPTGRGARGGGRERGGGGLRGIRAAARRLGAPAKGGRVSRTVRVADPASLASTVLPVVARRGAVVDGLLKNALKF